MSDPADVAAQRAWERKYGSTNSPWREGFPNQVSRGFVDAAREALNPIRDELDKLAKATEPPCNWEIWAEAYSEAIDRISHYCFSTEEMNR